MKSALALLLLIGLAASSPVAQRDADWKERLAGLNTKAKQNAPVVASEEEEVQPQVVKDEEEDATDDSPVQVNQEKQAANWWEKDNSEAPAVEADEEAVVPEVNSAPIAEEDAAAVPLEEEADPVEPVAIPAADVAAEGGDSEVVRKVSQQDVETTWNKQSRQEKEPGQTKPWWEESSSSDSPAPLAATTEVPAEKAAGVTELSIEPVEEAEEAAEVHGKSNKNVKPLRPHHSSVNQAHGNSDE